MVPAKGVERWLTQRLSHRLGAGPRGGDGVCAGRAFPQPALAGRPADRHRATTTPGTPTASSGRCSRSSTPRWTSPGAPRWRDHLGHGAEGEQAELRRDRRYSVARRLAGLFAAYAVQRPAMLADWRAGPRHRRDRRSTWPTTSAGSRELWRLVLRGRQIGAAPPPDAPAPCAARGAAIRAGAPLALPDRLSMFGHTRMAATELELLRAVGEVREVHLWLPAGVAGGLGAAGRRRRRGAGAPRRRPERPRCVQPPAAVLAGPGLPRAPALAGRCSAPSEVHEAGRRRSVRTRHPAGPAAGRPARRPRRRTAPAARLPAASGAGDRSVQVHACHGATRQVEVLREVLVGLLEDDPTLEPRDVLVMCPDVEAYAPLFSAAFGLGGRASRPAAGRDRRHPAHQLRVRLADRGLASTNPLLAMAGTLVALAGGRGTASEVLDLAGGRAGPAPVRAVDDDDLATITGVGPAVGGPVGADRVAARDVQARRLPAEHLAGGARPAPARRRDGRGGGLRARRPACRSTTSAAPRSTSPGGWRSSSTGWSAACSRLREAGTLEEWLCALREGVLDLGSVPPRDGWQVAQFERELDTVLEAGTPSRRRRQAHGVGRTSSGSPTSAPCSSSGCSPGRRAPTSAPAT